MGSLASTNQVKHNLVFFNWAHSFYFNMGGSDLAPIHIELNADSALWAELGLGASLDSKYHWAAELPVSPLWRTFLVGNFYSGHSHQPILENHKVFLYLSVISTFTIRIYKYMFFIYLIIWYTLQVWAGLNDNFFNQNRLICYQKFLGNLKLIHPGSETLLGASPPRLLHWQALFA